jgi:hypothetical protein
MLSLNSNEFMMLAGTDVIVNMIRNRVKVPLEHVEWLEDFMDINGSGLYHASVNEHCVLVYFEQAIDAENVNRIIQKSKN